MGLLQEKPQPEAAQVDSRLETASGYPGRLVQILLSKPPRTHGALFGRTMVSESTGSSPFSGSGFPFCSRVFCIGNTQLFDRFFKTSEVAWGPSPEAAKEMKQAARERGTEGERRERETGKGKRERERGTGSMERARERDRGEESKNWLEQIAGCREDV